MRYLLAVGLIVGCSQAPAESYEWTSVDSAGIRVSTSTTSLRSVPEWEVSGPDVVLGTDGDTLLEFHHIVATASRTDGSLIVLSPTSLRTYSGSGQFLSRLAGEGNGPGELSAASGMSIRHDSLYVFDESLQRVSVYHPNAGYVRSFTIRGNFRSPQLVTVFEDGTTLLADRLFRVPRRGFEMLEMDLSRSSVDGTEQTLLSRQPLAEMGVLSSESVGMKTFGALTHLAGNGDGFWVALGEPQIERYDPNGALIQLIRWNAGDRRVSEAVLREHVESRLASVPPANVEAARLEFDAMPVADAMPASWRILAAREGDLWVQLYRPFTDVGPSTWIIFDPEGKVAGRVVLPPSFEAHHVADGRITGVAKDENDVERVHRYSLPAHAN